MVSNLFALNFYFNHGSLDKGGLKRQKWLIFLSSLGTHTNLSSTVLFPKIKTCNCLIYIFHPIGWIFCFSTYFVFILDMHFNSLRSQVTNRHIDVSTVILLHNTITHLIVAPSNVWIKARRLRTWTFLIERIGQCQREGASGVFIIGFQNFKVTFSYLFVKLFWGLH